MSTKGNSEHPTKVMANGEDAEASEAAHEFATLIKKETAQRKTGKKLENYEVRPCVGVRGYTLQLPVLRWKLWYPTATAAVKFAKRVATVYHADCHIYDASGQLDEKQFVQN